MSLNGAAHRAGVEPEDVDPRELDMGIEEEMEHTEDPETAEQIALDHLVEDPYYYTKLRSLFPSDDDDQDEHFPKKLLDCPVAVHVEWPTSFTRVGEAIRFDYSSKLHAEDESWRPFKHRITTGVSVWMPSADDMPMELREAKMQPIRRPFQPVIMGIADRLYFLGERGERVALARDGIGVDVSGMGDLRFDEYRLPKTHFAWDPPGRRLLGIGQEAEVIFLLEGGLLSLDDEAMLIG